MLQQPDAQRGEVIVGILFPKAESDALVQSAQTKGVELETRFATEVAMKIKNHGGVSGIQKTYGGGGPVKIAVIMEGVTPDVPIDVVLQ